MTPDQRERFCEHIQVLAKRYSLSWYNTVDNIDEARIVDGSTVPVSEGNERIAGLRENVEDAVYNRDGIRDRYERAQREGLFDLKHAKEVDEDTLNLWLASVEVMKGDKGRCIGELRHWREYLALAESGELPQCKHVPGDVVRQLAEAKSA